MDRRTFIGGIAGGLLAAPLAAPAQQVGKVYRIGILETIPASQNAAKLDALRKGLRDLGYVEGRNLIIEYRSADGRAERFPDLASELVRLKVDLIVTRGTPAAKAVKSATGTIPVVMAAMGEPLAVVATLAHPGGNITGLTTFSIELTGKRVEVIKELVPSLSRVALLQNMGNPVAPPEWEETKTAARSLGLQAELLDVRSQGDLSRAFELAVRQHVEALVIGIDGLTQMYQQTIVDSVARNRLPAIYPDRAFVDGGGLIAYAVNYPDLYLRAAGLIGKIFKGAKPAELPIEQPTKFDLVINLKTAKSLGLTIPQSLRVQAELIEG
jgi:putative tryptophan/tyrosine transport system substrate-binding protein